LHRVGAQGASKRVIDGGTHGVADAAASHRCLPVWPRITTLADHTVHWLFGEFFSILVLKMAEAHVLIACSAIKKVAKPFLVPCKSPNSCWHTGRTGHTDD
jgi:hypothetical protein